MHDFSAILSINQNTAFFKKLVPIIYQKNCEQVLDKSLESGSVLKKKDKVTTSLSQKKTKNWELQSNFD